MDLHENFTTGTNVTLNNEVPVKFWKSYPDSRYGLQILLGGGMWSLTSVVRYTVDGRIEIARKDTSVVKF